MKNKLVMAMITVVLASECFAGCSKKTIENSAASNASVLEENEKEAENAKKTENAEEMPEKLKTGNTEEMLEQHIKDQIIIRMIKRFLNAGIIENSKRIENMEGTPQGSILDKIRY